MTFDVAGIPIGELVRMLSPSLGQQKAEALVRSAAQGLGFQLEELFDRTSALQIMEAIAEQPGLVGVTARFAKSRVHLWGP